MPYLVQRFVDSTNNHDATDEHSTKRRYVHIPRSRKVGQATGTRMGGKNASGNSDSVVFSRQKGRKIYGRLDDVSCPHPDSVDHSMVDKGSPLLEVDSVAM